MNKRTITGVVLLGCLFTACSTKEEKKTVDAVSVVTETVGETDTGCFVSTYVGEVEALSSTAVSFTGSGTVNKVFVSVGQMVSKGQTIAVMDATQCRNAVMTAEAMMTQAQDAYDRMKTLHDQNLLSDMDWVEVQSRRTQAEASLRMAKKALADCTLSAPCSGVIGSKMLESGQVALPSQLVCNILDIRNVKVKINVPEKEISAIAKRATITVDALGGEQFHSIGMERGVSADAICRTYDIRYLVDNKEGRLLPGMVCEVNVESGKFFASKVSQGAERITLPITSVQRGADGKMFVWTVKNGTAHRTIVSVGNAYGNRIAILNGISSGDNVVVKGNQKLNEGANVIYNR